MEKAGRADLHVHTTASDGTVSPEETVRQAAEIGLAAVGIADHDTISGVEPAMAEGHAAGIFVVPGVEINTDYGRDEIHILGYFIDIHNADLLDRLHRLRSGREERGRSMVEKLNAIGVNVSFDRVMEIAHGAVGRPHIARAITEAGYANSINTAFGKYLARGAPAYVPRYKVTPIEAIEVIRRAGGVPVFAHPGNSSHDNLIPEFVVAGMQGLEAYHTDHSPSQVEHYVRLARKHGLIVTGGSDSHGPNMLKMVEVGHVTVDVSVVEQLEQAATRNRTGG